MKSQKGFAWLPILLVILGLAVVGGGAYYFTHQQSTVPQVSLTNTTPIQQTTNTTTGNPVVGTTVQTSNSQSQTPTSTGTPASSGQSGTIGQNGQTLTLNGNAQITGTIPTNFATAQIYAVPSPWTGPTDHASLYELTRGYSDYNKNVQYSGVKVDANGNYSIPLSYLVQDSPFKNYTLFLFGIPANDPTGQYHDSDFVIAPTLLATGHITITGGQVPACTSQPSAFIPQSSLDSVASSKSLLSIDGYACNTSKVNVVVSMGTSQILQQTVSVSYDNWEAGKEMALTDGTYTVQVYDGNGNLLTTDNFTVQPNTATIDSSSLTQSISAAGSAGVYITGTASVQVIGCLVGASYTGATDYNTLNQASNSANAGMGVGQNVGCFPNVLPSAGTTGNQKFGVEVRYGGPNIYGGMWPGTYRLYVFEGTALHSLLTTTTFTLTQ